MKALLRNDSTFQLGGGIPVAGTGSTWPPLLHALRLPVRHGYLRQGHVTVADTRHGYLRRSHVTGAEAGRRTDACCRRPSVQLRGAGYGRCLPPPRPPAAGRVTTSRRVGGTSPELLSAAELNRTPPSDVHFMESESDSLKLT